MTTSSAYREGPRGLVVRLHRFWRPAQAKKEDGRLFRKFVARIEALEEELEDKANKNSALAYSVKILREQLEEAECAFSSAHRRAGDYHYHWARHCLWMHLGLNLTTSEQPALHWFRSLSLIAEGFTGPAKPSP